MSLKKTHLKLKPHLQVVNKFNWCNHAKGLFFINGEYFWTSPTLCFWPRMHWFKVILKIAVYDLFLLNLMEILFINHLLGLISINMLLIVDGERVGALPQAEHTTRAQYHWAPPETQGHGEGDARGEAARAWCGGGGATLQDRLTQLRWLHPGSQTAQGECTGTVPETCAGGYRKLPLSLWIYVRKYKNTFAVSIISQEWLQR